jgi:phenylpropionate dioxygenase-like ring-hydroxylating dioxygenase large terminal subunit
VLSQEENKLITQVGPGTPMGNLFRRFWLPAMLSEELPGPDCPPVKLRLLGEDLVAFRTTSGRVGVLDTYCSHRGANLYWGRNEEEGLRCVYHGWKYNVDGACVDQPNEPPQGRFAERIRHPAYQAIDVGGVIWVHMGPNELEPRVPDFEWLRMPASQRVLHKRFQACNYLQNLEGEVDSAHAPFLHGKIGPDGHLTAPNPHFGDRTPVFSLKETDYGLVMCARRDAGPDQYYWRITPFMLPTYALVAGLYMFTAAVPVDDLTTIGITVVWHPEREVSRDHFSEWCPVDERYYPIQNKGNEYLIDRHAQKTESFTGIRGTRVQDHVVQEDQRGPISDRTKEHLGSSDVAVMATRKILLSAVRALEKGYQPSLPANPSVYAIRAPAPTTDRNVSLDDVIAEYMPVDGKPAVQEFSELR